MLEEVIELKIKLKLVLLQERQDEIRAQQVMAKDTEESTEKAVKDYSTNEIVRKSNAEVIRDEFAAGMNSQRKRFAGRKTVAEMIDEWSAAAKKFVGEKTDAEKKRFGNAEEEYDISMNDGEK